MKRGEKVKINKKKLETAMAQNCIGILELADISNVSRTVLFRIGKENSNLRPVTVGKIAKALNCDVTELIEQEN